MRNAQRPPLIDSGAVFDPSGAYRYRLWRRWDPALGTVAFIMLNPSTADADRDDPTIRRCLGFTRAWGFGSLEVVNLFAYRATRPADLRRAEDPVGPENDRHILEVSETADRVVAAWGNHGAFQDRAGVVLDLLRPNVDLHRLPLSRGGQPRHPLRSSGQLVPVPFPEACATSRFVRR